MLPLLAILALGSSTVVAASEESDQERYERWVLLVAVGGLSVLDTDMDSNRFALMAFVEGRISSAFVPVLRSAIESVVQFEGRPERERAWGHSPVWASNRISVRAERESPSSGEWRFDVAWDLPVRRTSIVQDTKGPGASVSLDRGFSESSSTVRFRFLVAEPQEGLSDGDLTTALDRSFADVKEVAVRSGLIEELFYDGAPGRLKRDLIRRIERFIKSLERSDGEASAQVVGYLATQNFRRFSELLFLDELEEFERQFVTIESRIRGGWRPDLTETDPEFVVKARAERHSVFA